MKAANSYATLLLGVSQQSPAERAEGQHTEQVNMWSDPVNGLIRRQGSQLLAERALTGVTSADLPNIAEDTAKWRSFDFTTGGKEYTLLLRGGAQGGSVLPPVVAYNKTDNRFMPFVRNTVDVALDSLTAYGVSAVASVGKYVFCATHGAVISGESVNRWDTPDNLSRAVAWVRGGAYSRRYVVSVRMQNGSVFTAEHTTPPSSYQTALDTSDILTSDPDYTKKVNDRVNAYNSAVTAHIGTAAAAIQPEAIATELANNLVLAGLPDTSTAGSHIIFANGVMVQSIQVEDGGDGSLMRGVADEIESADKVSPLHYVGKVVKVRGKNSQESFYLRAVAKDKFQPPGYMEVTWVEAAGVEHSITGGLFYVTTDGTSLFMASSASLLNAIYPGDHPTFSVSKAGDHDSSPMPFMVGDLVSYLGTFQNRLLVGSGGVLAVSRTDDYLNFFRSTVLTLPADDAFEMPPSGDDTFVHSVLYDQNLVVFGNKRQYIIRGTAPLTPTGANMAVMSSHRDVVDAPPVAAGGFLMYAKNTPTGASVHQIQPGQTENSPESYPASSQLADYLSGDIVELLSTTGTPSTLFLRTTGSRNSLYVFSYLDTPQGRKMDSWGRWDFNPALGYVIGLSAVQGGIHVYTIREGAAGIVYTVADFLPTDPSLSDRPYLDSQRPIAHVQAGTNSVRVTSGSAWAAAFTQASPRRFTGALLPSLASLLESYPEEPGLVVGSVFDSSLTPTNPFMRDGKGKVILSGRLTIAKVIAAFRNSSGMVASLSYRGGASAEYTFNGRVLGDTNNLIGIEPIGTGQWSIPIGKETHDYTLTIKSRKWHPLAITSLEWVGQFFNRVQRF